MGAFVGKISPVFKDFQASTSQHENLESKALTSRLSSMRLPLALCGGKAFNLSFLHSVASQIPGARVLDGLAVLTTAFDWHVGGALARTQLLKDCASLAVAWPKLLAMSEADQRSALSELQEKIRDGVVEDALNRELKTFLDEQKDVHAYAVRSSATDEDSGANAFAGQYLTMLNQSCTTDCGLPDKKSRPIEEVVSAAVVSVWCSAFSWCSFTYRQTRKVTSPPHLGVVIMPQLNSAVSGVLFTQNPLEQNEDVMLLEATYGQGEGVVSGEVGVDRWTLSKANQRVLAATIATKEEHYGLNDAGGLKMEKNETAQKDAACLSMEQLHAVTKAGVTINALYGSPQDIEWAISTQKELVILQSRPITTLAKPKVEIKPGEFTGVGTTWTIENAHYSQACPLVFQEPTSRALTRTMRAGFARYGCSLDYLENRFVKGFCYMCPRAVGAPLSAGGGPPPPKPIFRLLFSLHPEIRRRRAIAARVFEEKNYLKEWNEWNTKVRAEVIQKHIDLIVATEGMETLPDKDFMSVLQRAYEHACYGFEMHHQYTIPAVLPMGDLIVHAEQWGLDFTIIAPLVERYGRPLGVLGFADKIKQWEVMVNSNAELRELLFQDDKDEKSGTDHSAEIWQRLQNMGDGVGDFLKECTRVTQYRLCHSFDCTQPTLREQPQYIVNELRQSAKGHVLISETEQKELQEKRARVRERVPEAMRTYFDETMKDCETMAPIRDERHLWNDGIATGIFRTVMLEAGRRFTKVGRVYTPEHLMELTIADIRKLFELGKDAPGVATKDELQAARLFRDTTSWSDMPPYIGQPPADPPSMDMFPADSRRVEAACMSVIGRIFNKDHGGSKRAGGKALSGIAGGVHKTIEGKVRVVKSSADLASVGHGDVVVAVNTSAAFNSVIAVCGAVITEGGGLLSHAAVTARELDKVAVVAVVRATTLLTNGERVRVNGKTGVITKLVEAEK